MRFFKRSNKAGENEARSETDSLETSDFWLLLFVSVVTLLLVFNFYS